MNSLKISFDQEVNVNDGNISLSGYLVQLDFGESHLNVHSSTREIFNDVINNYDELRESFLRLRRNRREREREIGDAEQNNLVFPLHFIDSDEKKDIWNVNKKKISLSFQLDH